MAFTNLFNVNDEPSLLKSIFDNHKVAVYTDDNQSAELEMTFEGVTSGGITQTSGQFVSSFGYDDDYSKRLFHLGKVKNWNSGDTGSITLRFSDIDFSNNPFRVIAGGQGNQSGDTLVDRARILVWNPDIGFRKLKAFRCDSEGIPSMTGNYIKVSGIIQFSLVNNESAVDIGADSSMAEDFFPIGKFKLTITDGTTSIPGEDNVVTNQGTEVSVRDAMNGIKIDEIFNCAGLNIDNASCMITASILDQIGGNELYAIFPIQLVVSGNYFLHLAPDGSGLGIGGPPMHGKPKEPALDIHFPTYLEQLTCSGVDMALDEEAVAVWAEKIGSNVTLRQILDYLLNRMDVFKTIYQVGDIKITTNNINPGTYISGTVWVEWGSGRVPVGVNPKDTDFKTAEKTGGEKTHKLTTTEMPSHKHTRTDEYRYSIYRGTRSAETVGAISGSGYLISQVAAGGGWNGTDTTPSAGGGSAHNNLQPYITCYMWKRVA